MAPPPPPPLPRPPPADLPEDLIEEILLRFPPGEPASLFRAALVCKRWRRLVSGAGFRRRFREFHRTPPMLGVFCWNDRQLVGRFVPTTTTPFRPHHAERARMTPVDTRHGRVLFPGEGGALVVWDPITDEEWKVPFPPQYTPMTTCTATVLCSAAGGGGCDHLDCHRGPFVVVFAGTVWDEPAAGETFVCAYLSDAASWSEPTTCGRQHGCFIDFPMRSTLVGNALYFQALAESRTLTYNLESHQMSWILLPFSLGQSVLTTMEDGGLGLATEHESKLYIRSTKVADGVGARWEQNRVFDLRTLLPVDADFTSLDVVGSTDDLGTIFVRAANVVYAVDLNTYKVKKVYEGKTNIVVPYMSFYTPDTALLSF